MKEKIILFIVMYCRYGMFCSLELNAKISDGEMVN